MYMIWGIPFTSRIVTHSLDVLSWVGEASVYHCLTKYKPGTRKRNCRPLHAPMHSHRQEVASGDGS